MRPFQDLVLWQKAHALTLDIYRLTGGYPEEERFGLTQQTRRSASSVPGNISEGCGLRTFGQLRNRLDSASGSLSELEYWLILGRDLNYYPDSHYPRLLAAVEEERKLLFGYVAWAAKAMKPNP